MVAGEIILVPLERICKRVVLESIRQVEPALVTAVGSMAEPRSDPSAAVLGAGRVTSAVLSPVFGAIGLVTLLLVLWAVFIRKRGRRRRSHHHSHHHSAGAVEGSQPPGEGQPPATEEKRGRHRRSRRRHRRRNPTLAETGGLPPIRPEIGSEPEP